MQAERRHVDEALARVAACRAERGRCEMVHAPVRFPAALAQDADAVQHDVHIVDQRVPRLGVEELVQPYATLGRRARKACADGYVAVEAAKRGDGMPADEAVAAEHEHASRARAWQSIRSVRGP